MKERQEERLSPRPGEGGGRGVGRSPFLGQEGVGVVVTLQAKGLAKMLFGYAIRHRKRTRFFLLCTRLFVPLTLRVEGTPSRHRKRKRIFLFALHSTFRTFAIYPPRGGYTSSKGKK